VAALNKQGNLNEFFDVTAGNGAIVPRKRQPYASKRLQKVVSDFRNKRKAGSTSPTSDQSEGSGAEVEAKAPVKKKKKSAGNARGKRAVQAGNAKRGKSISRGRPRSPMGTMQGSSGEDDEFEDAHEENAGTPPPLRVQLRPRPKPMYKGA
jgi:DNA excision repair protein ERCC-5